MIELLDTLQTVLHMPSRGATIGGMVAAIVSLYVMAKVIHFSYHFYIDHGFILVEGYNHQDRVRETLRKLSKEDSFFAIGYPFALIAVVLFFVACFGIGHFWYVVLPVALFASFIFIPAIGIRIAAKEKRNKVVFEKKLDGTYDESI